MKILLAPYGTRGDVQPLIALGVALRDRGHYIEFSAPDNFRSWIESLNFAFHPVGVNIEQTMRVLGDGARTVAWQMRHLYDELIPAQFNSLPSIFPSADIIVGASIQFAGASVAEQRGVPYVTSIFCPAALPSSYHAALPVRWQKLPRLLNTATWLFTAAGVDLALRKSVNRGRKNLGLEPVASPLRHLISGDRLILAADRGLAPPPSDLPDNVIKVDSFVFEEPGSLDDDLNQFLDSGPPPVYVGFGSMVTSDVDRATRIAVAAAEMAGCRLILGSGWTGLGVNHSKLPVWCRVVKTVPHHLLFPHCAMVVHHGGAGTTTTAARAGAPQIIVPHLLDQFYWAHRIQALRLGPKPIRFNQLTSAKLAQRIRATFDDASYRHNATRMGVEIRSREGITSAVQIIEELGAKTGYYKAAERPFAVFPPQ